MSSPPSDLPRPVTEALLLCPTLRLTSPAQAGPSLRGDGAGVGMCDGDHCAPLSGQLHHGATIHVRAINIPLEYPCQSHSSPGPGFYDDHSGPTLRSHPDWWLHIPSHTGVSLRQGRGLQNRIKLDLESMGSSLGALMEGHSHGRSALNIYLAWDWQNFFDFEKRQFTFW